MNNKNDNLKEIAERLFENNILSDGPPVYIRRATLSDCIELTELYSKARERGDWFGGRLACGDFAGVEDLLSCLLTRKEVIFVIFHGVRGEIFGATLLEFDGAHGILIDETQIDPELGRRKGIMSSYFRRLIPILDYFGPYWTEFVMTENSRVLRKVLIGEFGMKPLAYFPAYYSAPNGRRLSNLVAYGPATVVEHEISIMEAEVCARLDIFQIFRNADIGVSADLLRKNEYGVSENFEKKIVDLSSNLAPDIQKGFRIVGVIPYERKLVIARWPEADMLDLDLAIHENNKSVTNLICYVLR